jgi:hypothetical protein
MSIDNLLGLEGARCIEPAYAELTDDIYTGMILEGDGDEARLLVDEEEQPIAFALHSNDDWLVANFVYRHPSMDVIQRFEDIGGDIYQEPRSAWIAGLREYYSRIILEEIQPAAEDLSGDRPARLEDLIAEVWGRAPGVGCVDCCCGSGVGSMTLRAAGMHTLAYDNDSALLALGLSKGRLLPEETMWIDGTRATAYLPPMERGAAFMLGDIAPWLAPMWEEVVNGLLALSSDTIITVATEREIRLVEEWCAVRGRAAEVFENTRDPVYDRWVCVAHTE